MGRILKAGRSEIVTTGVDDGLQLIGGSPFGGNASLGLRIPALVPTDVTNRYLFMLATFSLGDTERARIRGFRQYVSLGFDQVTGGEGGPFTHRVVQQQILDPQWHPPDGDISWHLMDLGVPSMTGIPKDDSPLDRDNFAFRTSDGPALLYETAVVPGPPGAFYTNLTAYTPPNRGMPWGTPLIDGGMGIMYDLRTDWRNSRAWDSLDIGIEGPKTIALFASVRQTNPSTRVPLALPSPFFSSGLPVEEVFLLNFPSAIYWRIAGSLIVETAGEGLTSFEPPAVAP